MNRTESSFAVYDCAAVNERIRTDAAAFVAEEEARYAAQIDAVAQGLLPHVRGCCPIMQCGPSSVGKTTTAARLCEALRRHGVNAVTISLDDFYRGAGMAPRMPDGRFDYESPEALDIACFVGCVGELLTAGETRLPRYDFLEGRPAKETVPLKLTGDTAVFFEGVHAFAPRMIDSLRTLGAEPLRMFVNARSRFSCGGEILLSRGDIRLARRLIRDERTRASSFYNTMTMWEQVLYGVQNYILPYADEAEFTVDTTLCYEPAVMAQPLLDRLHTLDGTPYEAEGRRLYAAFARFERLPLSAVPVSSVLTEFLGAHESPCVLPQNGV